MAHNTEFGVPKNARECPVTFNKKVHRHSEEAIIQCPLCGDELVQHLPYAKRGDWTNSEYWIGPDKSDLNPE